MRYQVSHSYIRKDGWFGEATAEDTRHEITVEFDNRSDAIDYAKLLFDPETAEFSLGKLRVLDIEVLEVHDVDWQ